MQFFTSSSQRSRAELGEATAKVTNSKSCALSGTVNSKFMSQSHNISGKTKGINASRLSKFIFATVR